MKRRTEELKVLFDTIDGDRSGSIDQEELSSLFNLLGMQAYHSGPCKYHDVIAL